MTDQEYFTASNGIKLDKRGNIFGPRELSKLQEHHLREARKEFYQHLRDQELGRWRDPENPDIVVYPEDGGANECWVSNEKDPTEYEYWAREHVAEGSYSSVFGHDTAKRYFDAHPETKPWHGAQPGEAWLVTFDDHKPEPMIVSVIDPEPHFLNMGRGSMPTTDHRISHAEKIYPREETE